MAVLLPSVGATQTVRPTDRPAADFRMQVWGETAADFTGLVHTYDELRARLQHQLPPMLVTDDVRQIRRGTQSLARAIRRARRGAVQGEFFTSATATEFKRVLALITTPLVCSVIMDENPGGFRHAIDGNYPSGEARATTPGVILQRLPALPADIEFRFIGPHLILYDARANTIIDRLPRAVACDEPDD